MPSGQALVVSNYNLSQIEYLDRLQLSRNYPSGSHTFQRYRGRMFEIRCVPAWCTAWCTARCIYRNVYGGWLIHVYDGWLTADSCCRLQKILVKCNLIRVNCQRRNNATQQTRNKTYIQIYVIRFNRITNISIRMVRQIFIRVMKITK